MQHGGVSVFAGVGERTREGNDPLAGNDGDRVIDKVALVYGQMNEPPGACPRVGLSALTMAEYFRDQSQDAFLHRQHLPLRAGGLRGVRAARPDAERRRLPADARHRDGPAAGAHHVDAHRFGHPGAGDLCPRRRPHRPCAREHVRAPRRVHRALAPDLREGDLPGDRPARLLVARPRPHRRRRRALRHRDARAGRYPALQGPAGHHRDPRHGRASPTRTSSSCSVLARSSGSSRSR